MSLEILGPKHTRYTISRRTLFVALGTGALGGCGRSTFSYHTVRLQLPISGAGALALATLDHRDVVTTGRRTPDFVGTVTAPDGDTTAIFTGSGDAFSSDVTGLLQGALSSHATRIETDHRWTRDRAFESLVQSGRDHLLLLTIDDWQSKTRANTELRYDLTLEVRNAGGAVQGRSHTRGTDQLSVSGADAMREIEKACVDSLAKRLRMVLLEPRIQEAFRRDL